MNTDVSTLPVRPVTVADPPPPVRRSYRRRGPARWVVLLCLVIVGILMLAPFVIIMFNAFKTPVEYRPAGRSRCRTGSTSTA